MDNTTQLSSYADMTDEELYGFYYGVKGVIDECGMHELSMKKYLEVTTEIACRYFDEKGLYNRKAREDLLKQMIYNTTSGN